MLYTCLGSDWSFVGRVGIYVDCKSIRNETDEVVTPLTHACTHTCRFVVVYSTCIRRVMIDRPCDEIQIIVQSLHDQSMHKHLISKPSLQHTRQGFAKHHSSCTSCVAQPTHTLPIPLPTTSAPTLVFQRTSSEDHSSQVLEPNKDRSLRGSVENQPIGPSSPRWVDRWGPLSALFQLWGWGRLSG